MTTPAAAPPARPEPDAIGVAQDTIIGVAFAVPGVSVGITLAALAAATAYARGLVMADVLSLGVAPAAQDRSSSPS
jgi:hypothetical protein